MKKTIIVGCCACAAAVAVTTQAAAEPAFTTGKPSAGLRLQYGIDLEDHDTDLNFYGLGFGARGGYTLDFGLYVGGQFEYFFGGSEEAAGIEISASVWQLQAEAGYDIGLGPTFALRPQLGLGLAGISAEVCIDDMMGGQACGDDSETDFALSPGALAMYDVGPVFLTGELRFNMIMAEESANALFIGVGAGMPF